jgi:small subunit ribosomal protein S11
MSEDNKQLTENTEVENTPVETTEASVEVEKKEKQGKSAMQSKAKGKKKKKVAKNVPVGKAFIKATYNNTLVTLTDPNGNIIAWSSAGLNGFKGPKKATPFAASIIVKDAVEKAKVCGLKDVSVFVKGVGMGRESAIRGLNSNGLNIISIKDVTPIPHNGCRKRRPRRV